MKASEIFSLAIRLAGLWLLLNALPSLPSTLFKLWSSVVDFKVAAVLQTSLSLVWTYVIAFWFLGGAPWIQRKAYP